MSRVRRKNEIVLNDYIIVNVIKLYNFNISFVKYYSHIYLRVFGDDLEIIIS